MENFPHADTDTGRLEMHDMWMVSTRNEARCSEISCTRTVAAKAQPNQRPTDRRELGLGLCSTGKSQNVCCIALNFAEFRKLYHERREGGGQGD